MTRLDGDRLARLDAHLAGRVEDGTYERLEWLIGGPDGALHEGGTTAGSTFRIYSMTKPVVSVAVLQLVEEARLQLFHPVHLYLPEFRHMKVLGPDGPRPAARPITIRDLLTHMSGLSYGFLPDHGGAALQAARVHADGAVPLREDVAKIAKTPLMFDPGAGWGYSVATDVLGAVLEVVEARPLGAILSERVFQPLGMESTGFTAAAPPPEIRGGDPKGGLISAQDIERAYPSNNPDFARGGHGLFSTIEDYAAFAGSLLRTATGGDGPHLLSPAALAAATANHVGAVMPLHLPSPVERIAPGLEGQGFGLGFAVTQPAGPTLASPGAFGWSGAAETWFTVDPAKGVTMVFMAQHFDWPGAVYEFQNLAYAALR